MDQEERRKWLERKRAEVYDALRPFKGSEVELLEAYDHMLQLLDASPARAGGDDYSRFNGGKPLFAVSHYLRHNGPTASSVVVQDILDRNYRQGWRDPRRDLRSAIEYQLKSKKPVIGSSKDGVLFLVGQHDV